MAQIITQDGTVLQNGVSRPYRPLRDTSSRRPPPVSGDPRDRDPHADPRDHSFEAYRALALVL